MVHPYLIKNGVHTGLPAQASTTKANIIKHRLNADETLLDILPELLPEVLLL